MTPWPVLLINDYIEHGASNMNVLEPILRALGYPVSGCLLYTSPSPRDS